MSDADDEVESDNEKIILDEVADDVLPNDFLKNKSADSSIGGSTLE